MPRPHVKSGQQVKSAHQMRGRVAGRGDNGDKTVVLLTVLRLGGEAEERGASCCITWLDGWMRGGCMAGTRAGGCMDVTIDREVRCLSEQMSGGEW